ncbi:hypothetical protein Sjap_026671 [Stephania japonica]|uniref:Uncharacterized protein n=1 Tax=Stephania japonica TaxID=461633 RepID=A0AAP0E234_9MAGN
MTTNRLGVGKENRLIGLVLALISFLIRRRNPSMKEALRFALAVSHIFLLPLEKGSSVSLKGRA